LAVYIPAVAKELLQLAEDPVQAPDQVREYDPLPPEAAEIKVTG
jgi:hypothetical protein